MNQINKSAVQDGSIFKTITWTIARCVLWLVIVFGVYLLMGKQAIRLWQEMEIDLTSISTTFIRVVDLITAYWFVIPFVLVIWLAIETLVMRTLTSAGRKAWTVFVWMLPMLALLFAVVALGLSYSAMLG